MAKLGLRRRSLSSFQTSKPSSNAWNTHLLTNPKKQLSDVYFKILEKIWWLGCMLFASFASNIFPFYNRCWWQQVKTRSANCCFFGCTVAMDIMPYCHMAERIGSSKWPKSESLSMRRNYRKSIAQQMNSMIVMLTWLSSETMACAATSWLGLQVDTSAKF